MQLEVARAAAHTQEGAAQEHWQQLAALQPSKTTSRTLSTKLIDICSAGTADKKMYVMMSPSTVN